MYVRASTEYLHTVIDGAKRFTIPCSQAIVAIRYRNKHRDDYYSAYYSNKNYHNTYVIPIELLPCESTWDVPSHVLEEVMLPPIATKQPGRPPKNDRKKKFTERKGRKEKSLVVNVVYLAITRRLAQKNHMRISVTKVMQLNSFICLYS
ncbi:hypothetical protein RDI58_017748 [Solanum bulbocastanum]|uniref:Uncharacterized protein n=1 Tax=Solanum bulbocastanum TaxID=147425 RepID=A0AAN8TCW7_SOLBU